MASFGGGVRCVSKLSGALADACDRVTSREYLGRQPGRQ